MFANAGFFIESGVFIFQDVSMKLSTAAIDAEHKALDAITVLLDKPANRKGLTARQIADATGLAIGRVQTVMDKSEIILKQRSHNRHLWWNDWRDCEERWRPKRKPGRPKVSNPSCQTPCAA